MVSKVGKLPRASGPALAVARRGPISQPEAVGLQTSGVGWRGRPSLVQSPSDPEVGGETETKTRLPSPPRPSRSATSLPTLPTAEGASLLRHGKLILLWILQGRVIPVPSLRSPRRTQSLVGVGEGAGLTGQGAEEHRAGGDQSAWGPTRQQTSRCLSAPARVATLCAPETYSRLCWRRSSEGTERRGHLPHPRPRRQGRSCFVDESLRRLC